MTVEQAKQVLKDNGYFVDNLWSVRDVQDMYECTEEQAQEVLDRALTNGHIVSEIFYSIQVASENLGYKLI